MKQQGTVSSAAGGPFLPPGSWRPISLGTLFVVLFLPQILYLATVVWEEERYSHGFLIPFVSAFYLYVNRERIRDTIRRPANVGLLSVGLGIVFWIYAQGVHFNALAHLSMLLVLAGMVVFAAGWSFLRAVAFPLFFLVFCFPVPKRLDDLYIVGPLQGLASRIAEHVIDLCGIPVFRQGHIVEVPGIQIQVEEACSGIHSLYSLIALGTAFVFLTDRRPWERVVLILSTVPIAIFANVFRVSATGILTAVVSPEFARGFLHEFSGLLVFLLGLLLFLSFAWFLSRWFPVPAGRERGAGGERGGEEGPPSPRSGRRRR